MKVQVGVLFLLVLHLTIAGCGSSGSDSAPAGDTTNDPPADDGTIDPPAITVPPSTNGNQPVTFSSRIINFTGQLDILSADSGDAVYSGTALGTVFTGSIDYSTAAGQISDGTTATTFDCCFAAGRLDITDNEQLDTETAELLNRLSPVVSFGAGDLVDTVNIEGDTFLSNGRRVEVGISYILDANSYDDVTQVDYPIDQYPVLLKLFFFLEHDADGDDDDDDYFDAIGLITSPAITSLPVSSATAGSLYSYSVEASDQNAGDTLIFSLDGAPDGMTIDASSGQILWSPPNGLTESESIVVRVTDSSGGFDIQSYTLLIDNSNVVIPDETTVATTPASDSNQNSGINMFAVSGPSVGTHPNTLISVDVVSGQQTVVNSIGVAVVGNSMDWNPVDGKMYSTDFIYDRGAIHEIDLVSGTSVRVASIKYSNGVAADLGAMTFASDGSLYAADGYNIFLDAHIGIVDLENELFKPVMTVPQDVSVSAMEIAPDGVLYAIYRNRELNSTIVSLNPGTLQVISEVPTSQIPIVDLDFAANGVLYHSDFGLGLFKIDPVTGGQSVIGYGEAGFTRGLASTTP